MANRSVLIRLGLDSTSFNRGIDQAKAKTQAFADQGDKAFRANRDAFDGLADSALKIGAVVGVGVGAAVKTFADFDQQMSAVAATGDDARRNLQGLRDAAVEAGATTAYSATEAAAGVENLLKAGVDAREVMGGGLKGALDLAAAGGLGVAEAAEYAATAMTQFNLEGADVPHIADLLAAGAGKAQGEVSDLGAALAQSGLVANAYGLSLEETTGTLSAFASAGLLGSDAGTSFKTMLQSLGNPSAKAAELMDELGIAAYDAQGNFVGIEGLAGELKESLAGLTQEQRNAALATIFGSDAVRAANVLYDQGAEGIEKWTTDVNDAGFAAETAATRQDNLAGKIEELGGAIESAFIGAGEGANGPLKDLVENTTELVNAFGDLPAGAQQGTLAVAAVGAAGLLAFGGVVKVVGAVVDFKDNLAKVDPDGKHSGRIKSVGQAAGGAAAGLAAGALAAKLIQENTLNIPTGAGAATQALQALGSTADGSAEAMDRFFQVDTSGLTSGMTGLDDAITALTFDNGLAKFGSDLVGIVGIKDELALAKDQFAALDAQLRTMDPTQAAAGVAALTREFEQAGLSVDEIVAVLPQYKDQLAQQAAQLGQNNLTNEQYVAWMRGEIPPAVRAAGEAAVAAGQDTSSLGNAMEGVTVSAEELAEQTQTVIDNFTVLRNGALGAEQANNGWEASIDGLTAAFKVNDKGVKEYSTTLDANSAEGRTNRGVILDAIKAMDAKATADFKATSESKGLSAATDQASKNLATNRDRLEDAAIAAGFSRDEVRKMLKEYSLTPDQLRTQVSAPGAKAARDEVQGLGDDINDVNSKSVTVSVGYKVSSSGKVTVNGKNIGTAFATGGHVRGPGTETSDDIHALLSDNEFVVRASSVRALGVDRLNYINETGQLPAFARGGLVGRDLDVLMRTSEAPHIEIDRMTDKVAGAVAGAVADALPKAIGSMGGGEQMPRPTTFNGASLYNHEFQRLLRERRQLRVAGSAPGYDLQGAASAWDGLGGLRVSTGSMSGAIQTAIVQSSNLGPDVYGRAYPETGRISLNSRLRRTDTQMRATAIHEIGHILGLPHPTNSRVNSIMATAKGYGTDRLSGPTASDRNTVAALFSQATSGGKVNGKVVPLGSGDLVSFKGHRFTENFANRLQKVEAIVGSLAITQGGFRPSTSYSGTSHQGDAVDIAYPRASIWQTMRRFGIAAWDRTGKGNWIPHIHGVPLPGAGRAAGSAIWQAQDYLRGGDGLAAGGYVRGAGGPTDDMVPIWGSNGEFMLREKAAKVIGPDLLHALNGLGGGSQVVDAAGLANGGFVRYSGVDNDQIVRLIRAIERPIYDLAWQTKKVADLRKAEALEIRKKDQARRAVDGTKGDARARAWENYDKQADRAKAATDRLRQSQEELAQRQQAIADTARQAAGGFRDLYSSQSTDVRDWIELMRGGTKDLSAFQGQVERLRKAGLSEGLLQQIVGMGAVAGGDVATQLLGSKTLTSELNKASGSLQDAADKLGLLVTTGQGRYATGGLLAGAGTGTSDSMLIRASTGEYVVNARSTAQHLPLLHAINYGDRPAPRQYTANYATGGYVSGGPHIDSAAIDRIVDAIVANGGGNDFRNAQFGYDPREVTRRINEQRKDRQVMSGVRRGR